MLLGQNLKKIIFFKCSETENRAIPRVVLKATPVGLSNCTGRVHDFHHISPMRKKTNWMDTEHITCFALTL